MAHWFRNLTLGLAGLLILIPISILFASEMRLRKTYPRPVAFELPKTSPVAFEDAARRTRSFMCLDCHGEAGRIIFKAKGLGQLAAPNLSRVARTYSDAELEAIIRHGIKRDGTGVIAMPSATYAEISDEDVGVIIRYLRQIPEKPDAPEAVSRWGPLGRVALALNKIPFEADRIPAVKPVVYRPGPSDKLELGRYLTATTCQHCHELNSVHDNGFGMKTPALAPMVQGYSPKEFATLLRTGKATGGREVGEMSSVARQSFANFSDAETAAIYDYLRTYKP